MADRLRTLADVAEEYGFKDRKLRGIIKRRGIPVLRDGRDIRFDALALRSLEEALRCHAPEDCASPAVPTPAHSRSSAPSRGSAYDAALKATTVDSPKKKLQRLRRQSCEPHGTANVVALDRSVRR